VIESRPAIKSSLTYETPKVTEKPSVTSKKQMKGPTLGRCKMDSLAEDEVIFKEKGIVQLEGTEGSE
jgi:hypothetical protein